MIDDDDISEHQYKVTLTDIRVKLTNQDRKLQKQTTGHLEK